MNKSHDNLLYCGQLVFESDIEVTSCEYVIVAFAAHRKRTNALTNMYHYSDVIMGAMASQITSVSIVYSTVRSGTDKKTSKPRVTGLCEGNSPVTGEFPAQKA